MENKNKKKTVMEDDDDILELGNLMWNKANKNQSYRCPEWVSALLNSINEAMCRIYQNQHQEEYSSPFFNSGNNYKGKCFEVRSYKWDRDDDNKKNDFNFKYKDIEISWYKHLGRDETINRVITPKEGCDMFEAVMKELITNEKKNIKIEDNYGG